MAKIQVIDVDGSRNDGRKMMEYIRKRQKANQDIADAAMQNFMACYRKEAAAGRYRMDFKPDRRNSPLPACGGLPLYHSVASMRESHEDTYELAQDEIVPLIEKALADMGFQNYHVSLMKFNPTGKLFHAHLGFRIQATGGESVGSTR